MGCGTLQRTNALTGTLLAACCLSGQEMLLLPCALNNLILNYQFVPDASGCIACRFDTKCNACRFAALSVGRVEDGQLFCRYHGWGFKGGEEGRCSCNPQAVGARGRGDCAEQQPLSPADIPITGHCLPLSRTMHGLRRKHNRHFHVRQTQACWYIRGLSCCLRLSLVGIPAHMTTVHGSWPRRSSEERHVRVGRAGLTMDLARERGRRLAGGLSKSTSHHARDGRYGLCGRPGRLRLHGKPCLSAGHAGKAPFMCGPSSFGSLWMCVSIYVTPMLSIGPEQIAVTHLSHA